MNGGGSRVWSALIGLGVLGASASAQLPLGSAFTYQGRLEDGSGPVSATCDFEFGLWGDPTIGPQVGPALTFDGAGGNPPSIVVTDGLFEAVLDFGAGAFPGDARWLETRGLSRTQHRASCDAIMVCVFHRVLSLRAG